MQPRKTWILVGLLAVASALVTLAFVAQAFFSAPHTPVAAEIGFEALRVARGFPLYVDPWKGAWEDGAPPARYYVLYTPIFPWIVGKLSPATLAGVQLVGRLLSTAAWMVVLVAPVLGAKRENRRATAGAAMLAGGIYFLARHAASMSPDALATMLVTLGVLRAVRRDGLDPLAAVLIVAAPLVKPSCLGGVCGLALVHLALRRPGFWKASGAGLLAALVLFVGCQLASDGAWLSNMSRSTGQPLTLARWVQEFGGRAFVLGLPHVAVLVVAWRRRVSWLVLGPLAGSIAWTTFMMAKHGSGSHYWLEPTSLALIVIGQAPLFRSRAEPWGALAFGVAVIVTSWPLYLREPARYRRVADVTAKVDRYCIRSKGEFVVASDVMLELALNGRLAVPQWQSSFLARTGRFPIDAWREDLLRPEVQWLALGLDPRRPPADTNDERIERSVFHDVLKDVVLDNYALDTTIEGVGIWKRIRRSPSSAP